MRFSTTSFAALLSLSLMGVIVPATAIAQVCSGTVTAQGDNLGGAIPDPSSSQANWDTIPTASQMIVSAGGWVDDVDIEIDMTHACPEIDLRIELVSPAGTTVRLKDLDFGGSCMDDMIDTVFDDEAGSTFVSASPPFTGSWTPLNALSAFDGEPAGGTWVLNIYDGAHGPSSSGTLDDVNITIQTSDKDLDGDGDFQCAAPVDCNDADPGVNSNALELCYDSIDNDCDGTALSDDTDGDGFQDEVTCVNDGNDCDDGDPSTYPGAPEICGDGIDQSCSGSPDDDVGCQDLDLDGVPAYGPDNVFGTPDDDCDDGDPTVFPGAPEQCDGVDDDCDGNIDESFDGDNDGFFDAGVPGCVTTYGSNADCDDAVFAVNPAATEVCDAVDNNCSGAVDDDPSFNVDGDPVTTCGPDGVPGNGDDDCDDGDANTYPGAAEQCDRIDNDCDGTLPVVEVDDDGDGTTDCEGDCNDNPSDPNAVLQNVGFVEVCDGIDNDCDGSLPSSGSSSELDEDLDGQMVCEGDCVDEDPAANPLAPTIYLGATETADDGIDQDCNGADTVTCSEDADEDLFGDLGGGTLLSTETGDCSPTGMVDLVNALDCDDTDSTVFPGATEECDSTDSNCDGSLVDGFDDFDTDGNPDCVDLDDDNDLDPDTTDCNDLDATVFTGQDETLPIYVDDGIDQDCNGADTVTCYRDVDRDEFGVLQVLADDGQCDNSQQEASTDGDCDDGDATVNPGEDEVCDGVDNDCSGTLDEQEEDGDGDGWTICNSDGQPQGGDCDDSDSSIHPEAAEACDGKDSDCDGSIPPNEADGDSDGSPACSDCDDADPERSPEFTEQCDGVDNDCDDTVEDEELDGDGDGETPCNGDCDDTDASVTTAALEECDGVDTDCDGELLPEGEDDVDVDGARQCDGDCDDTDAQRYPGNTETCDGVDHDCSGSPTDDLDCSPDTPRSIGLTLPVTEDPSCNAAGRSQAPGALLLLLFGLTLLRRRSVIAAG